MATATTRTSSSRSCRLRRKLRPRMRQLVPHPSDSHHKLRPDLLPQVRDVRVDGALQALVVEAKSTLHQLSASERPPRLARERVQDAELARGQMHRLTPDARLAP